MNSIVARPYLPHYAKFRPTPQKHVSTRLPRCPHSEDNSTARTRPSNSIIRCGCGRTFLSKAALEQHRRDKTASAPASATPNPCVNIEVAPVPSSAPMESSKSPAKHEPDQQELGKVVAKLARASLTLSNSEPSISSSHHHDLICSYNWVDKNRPAVYVPGGAPIYKAISLPRTVKPDHGTYFIDENAGKVPDYPFEVVFQAAELMNPTVRFDEIDVLTDRHSLCKFFTFCGGCAQNTFRLKLHLVNDTLIIERCFTSTTEWSNGKKRAGFRHNFEKAVTRLPGGLENSLGHYSVLRYDFGGLKCAVCCQVNASYDVTDTSEHRSPQAERQDEKIASLATTISSVTVDKRGSGSTAGSVDKTGSGSIGGSADTIRRGVGTEQARIAEVKSKKKGNSSVVNPEWLPLLWFGRTQYSIVGRHDNGTFNYVHVHNLREQMKAWEEKDDKQDILKRVAMLLSRLRDIVRATEAKSCVLINEKGYEPDVLSIHESTSGKGPLPAAVVERFWSRGKH